MKKRYFKITLIDGKEHDLPFSKAFNGFVPDAPATTTSFLEACEEIASTGFMEPGSDARPKWIAPSQIKHVEVVIEEQKNNGSDLKIIASTD